MIGYWDICSTSTKHWRFCNIQTISNCQCEMWKCEMWFQDIRWVAEETQVSYIQASEECPASTTSVGAVATTAAKTKQSEHEGPATIGMKKTTESRVTKRVTTNKEHTLTSHLFVCCFCFVVVCFVFLFVHVPFVRR